MKSIIAAACLSLGLAACQTTITLPGYQPTSSQSLSGAMQDVKAVYTPPKGVKENQLRNTAVGIVLLTEPVANYVANAFRLELRSAGMRMGDGNCLMNLKVNDYATEDLGFNITYITDINYELAVPTPAWRKNVRISFTTDKLMEVSLILASIRDALAKNFDDVLRDAEFKSKIATYCRAAPAA